MIEAADHVGDDWRDAWKRYYRPLRFSAGPVSLLIRPSWIERAPDDPQRELILDPGRAFGTGLHESTRLCLRAMVELAAGSIVPRRAIDLGCGSGILGLAAARLWPALLEPGALCLADHDPEAVETARENAEANGMIEPLQFAIVNLDGARPPPDLLAFGQVDLILANIRPLILIPSAAAIIALLAPGGTLVLSGILDEEGDAVLAAYPSLRLLERPRDADWCALVLTRD
jgi:ribosomal protein L11 methyltransferase